MQDFISAKEIAKKWNISQRRVVTLCSENRIDGAVMVDKMWRIPSTASKPTDKSKSQKKAGIKPFVKWAGGKGQLISELENIFMSEDKRVFTKYVEPMVGGGALLFSIISKYKFEEIYIGDINAELINAYQVIRDRVDELIATLNEMHKTFLPLEESDRKVYYYTVRDKFNITALSDITAVEKASEFIFLNRTCFNGLYRVNKKGLYNVPMGAYKNPKICDEDNLRRVSDALKNVKIVCADYAQTKSLIDESTFVYLDPPYRPLSQTSDFTSYNTEIFNDAEQIRLAGFIDEINAKGAKFVLSNSDPKNSNSDDTFFDDLYCNYTIERVKVRRMINSKAENRGEITELLIYN